MRVQWTLCPCYERSSPFMAHLELVIMGLRFLVTFCTNGLYIWISWIVCIHISLRAWLFLEWYITPSSRFTWHISSRKNVTFLYLKLYIDGTRVGSGVVGFRRSASLSVILHAHNRTMNDYIINVERVTYTWTLSLPCEGGIRAKTALIKKIQNKCIHETPFLQELASNFTFTVCSKISTTQHK